MGVTEFVLELLALKAQIKGVFKGYAVAMLTFLLKKMVITCWPKFTDNFCIFLRESITFLVFWDTIMNCKMIVGGHMGYLW